MPKKIYKLKSTEDRQQQHIEEQYADELNQAQRDVVTQAEGPCLVLAGAGSGKTRTLMYRVAHLLQQGIPAERIIVMTFTNKAAKEMLARAEALLGQYPQKLWAGTFHHIGNRILRKYAHNIGYGNDFTIIDQADSQDLITQLIGQTISRDTKKFFPKSKVVQHIISFSTNSGASIESVFAQYFSYLDQELIDPIRTIARRYQIAKKERNLMDYDDLLVQWLRLMIDAPEIGNRLGTQFQYILVDEYQDTNYIQAKIIQSLSSVHQNILAVGDDAQSIYSFRAADIDNILSFPSHFENTKIFKLETNYRSTPQILNLANNSILHNQEQFNKQLTATQANGQLPALVATNNNEQQADFITQRIIELHQEGIALSDIAVLFRADYHVLELELVLQKKGIPYVKRGGIRFFEQAHLKDMIAFLRVLTNPKDTISWTRILMHLPGVGAVTAAKITDQLIACAPEKIYTTALTMPRAGQVAWKQIQNLLAPLTNQTTAADALQRIKNEFYEAYAKTVFDNATKRMEDIEQLINFSDQYDTVEALLTDISLSETFSADTPAAAEQTYDEQLVLSTIHQAKGLEWHTVFVIQLAHGQFPHAKSMNNQREQEEERRLFYVATTRAKQELYLTYPLASYSHNQGLIFNQPSLFITELDTSVYEPWSIEPEQSDELPTIEYLPDIS